MWRSIEEQEGKHVPQARFNPFNNDFLSRREFMEWSSGMVAVLSASACTRMPQQKIVPYNKTPEKVVPGKPLYFATTMTLNGRAIGVLAESHMGRPTKLDGNALHPASLGGSDAYAQAAVLGLYDPDRSQSLNMAGSPMYWENAAASLNAIAKNHLARRGEGFRILTEPVVSPSLAAQIDAFVAANPAAQWHQYEPVHRDTEREGALMAFGEDVASVYAFKPAEVVVSLDSDFLMEPANPRYARDFASNRTMLQGSHGMSRLYSAEASPTITGAKADNRIVARASEVEQIAAALAQACGVSVQGTPSVTAAHKKWVQAAAEDLKKHEGASLVVPGRWQTPLVHALAHAMNARLRNVGKTVRYTAPVEVHSVAQSDSIKRLALDMQAGKVETVLILGGNPVYNAPSDVKFSESLSKVKNRIHCGLYVDETASQCNYHIPEAHFLESWGDARAYDGTASLIQPLIAPLYGGKTYSEVLAAFSGDANAKSYDQVRAYWKGKAGGDFERSWTRWLNEGVVEGSASADKRVALRAEGSWAKVGRAPTATSMEVIFRPDATMFDGRFSNNGWLQEMPKPLSKLTWDNAAFVSAATAAALGIKNEQVIRIVWGGKSVDAPVWILPGHADNSVTLPLGYGRTHAGRLGTGTGFNAYSLRPSGSTWSFAGVEIAKTDKQYRLANTQSHANMEGRPIVRTATLAKAQKDHHWTHIHMHVPERLQNVDVGTAGGEHAPVAPAQYQWGMAINLSACNGCNSCVVACQAENNIPNVGKEEVIRGREMHWINLDRYYEGDTANPDTHFQPRMCVQCETAPCEVVCPVGATAHDNEGLNNMVYNRCVGTKYCSNNCPYKVRHFNFFEYTKTITPSMKMVQNPDVTVRGRGVMEKCTYCVQRISEARITAKNEGRKIRDGEVKTACQTACPSQAIFFGDISNPNSLVSKIKAESHNYGLLEELNTKPRTTYLGKVTNPNTALSAEKS